MAASNFYGNPSEKIRAGFIALQVPNGRNHHCKILLFQAFKSPTSCGLLSNRRNQINDPGNSIYTYYTWSVATECATLRDGWRRRFACFHGSEFAARWCRNAFGPSLLGNILPISRDHLGYRHFERYKIEGFDSLRILPLLLWNNWWWYKTGLVVQNTNAKYSPGYVRGQLQMEQSKIEFTGLLLNLDGRCFAGLIGSFNAYNTTACYAARFCYE